MCNKVAAAYHENIGFINQKLLKKFPFPSKSVVILKGGGRRNGKLILINLDKKLKILTRSNNTVYKIIKIYLRFNIESTTMIESS